jgi:hypothetical protein
MKLVADKVDKSQIKPLVDKAKQLSRVGNLTKAALKASLRELQIALRETHNTLKLKRLHWTLGPYKLKRLLENSPELRNTLDSEGVDYSDFLQTVSTGGA